MRNPTEEELEYIQVLTIRYNSTAEALGKSLVTVEQQISAMQRGGKFCASGTSDDIRKITELSIKLQTEE